MFFRTTPDFSYLVYESTFWYPDVYITYGDEALYRKIDCAVYMLEKF